MMNTKAIILWTIVTVAAAKAARDPTGYTIRENFDASYSERFGHRINPRERTEDCRVAAVVSTRRA